MLDSLKCYILCREIDDEAEKCIKLHCLYWSVTALRACCTREEFDRLLDAKENVLWLWDNQSDLCLRDRIFHCVRSMERFAHKLSWGYVAAAHLKCPQLTSTLYAVFLLRDIGKLDEIDKIGLSEWVKSCAVKDGSFSGEYGGDIDVRYVYCAIATLEALGFLEGFDPESSVIWLRKCYNSDGGFGCIPGAESHASYTYLAIQSEIGCRISILLALEILGCLEFIVDIVREFQIRNQFRQQLTSKWLHRRQKSSGGFNGRPEKLEDVCYSWWVLGSLDTLKFYFEDSGGVLDKTNAVGFVKSCQDSITGGLGPRPGVKPDIFHTLFGLLGMLLAQGSVSIDCVRFKIEDSIRSD